MFTTKLTLLILVLVILAGYGIHLVIFRYKRIQANKRFRESRDALYGINPRRGRKRVTYQTVSVKKQKLAWMLAQNRDVIAEGIKEYAMTQDVDNTSLYVDTFGVRHGLNNNKNLVRTILNRIVRGTIPIWDSTAKFLDRINKRTNLILRSLPHIINLSLHKLRTLIKLSSTKKGEADLGENNSIH